MDRAFRILTEKELDEMANPPLWNNLPEEPRKSRDGEISENISVKIHFQFIKPKTARKIKKYLSKIKKHLNHGEATK